MTAAVLSELDLRHVRTTGWAGGSGVSGRRLSYLPPSDVLPYAVDERDAEPAYAIADAWTPPHQLALAQDLCDRILAAARAVVPIATDTGTYMHDLPSLIASDHQAIVERFAVANQAWWGLELDRWCLGVKLYTAGERHPEHQDMHAGATGRKLAGVVQLSGPEDYQGGDLIMRCAHERIRMPRQRGTLVAFPGWTLHEVEPITAGERWSLCVNGWGPQLR